MTSSSGPGTQPLPWRLNDLLSLVVGLSVGLLGVVVGWFGVSGTPRVSQQTPWLNVAVGGVVVSGVAVVVWLTNGRRAVGERRRRLVPDGADALGTVPGGGSTTALETAAPEPLVILRGMGRYHRAGCELVAGKPVRALRKAPGRELSPCGVCRPGAGTETERADRG